MKTGLLGNAGMTDTVEIRQHIESLVGLTPEDVADAVVYVLSTPSHVQVHELTLQPQENH